MSLYNGGNGGRRNLNFSQYLNNLNEVSTQETPPEETFVDDDLSMFAGDFIDWSHTQQPELHAPVEAEVSAQNTDAAAAAAATTAAPAANLALDFTSPVAGKLTSKSIVIFHLSFLSLTLILGCLHFVPCLACLASIRP